MDLPAKIDFFAAIWRVMRDDNMSVQEVSGPACQKHVVHLKRRHLWPKTCLMLLSFSPALYTAATAANSTYRSEAREDCV